MAIITDGVKTKFTDDTGLPLIGGQVFSYVEGTSTPKDTYQDRAFTIPNTNPIILDDVGSCEMYLNGGYRLRVLTADGALVEEKDNAFQSDGQVLDVVANTTAIAALQTNVDVLNTRGGLKTDENNHIIGQGKAESATVYDLSLRSDKIRVSAPTDVEFGDLVFKTYDAPTIANGVTIPKGTWLNPALVVPLLGTAATKNVGTANGQVPLVEQVPSLLGTAATKNVGSAIGNIPSYTAGAFEISGIDGLGIGGAIAPIWDGIVDDVAQRPGGMRTGFYHFGSGVSSIYAESKTKHVLHMAHYTGLKEGWRISNTPNTNDFFLQSSTPSNNPWRKPEKIYHTGNTTIVNGSLKPSSPVVKIHTDSLELNDDAVKMGVTLNKRGVGDYLLQNTTGLRSDGGWRIELPQDVNGNPYFAVDYNELENNDIEVKTYKRIFDMNTFMFGPDLDSPVDIKEGRSIAIRFNDLPVEIEDDTQTEV